MTRDPQSLLSCWEDVCAYLGTTPAARVSIPTTRGRVVQVELHECNGERYIEVWIAAGSARSVTPQTLLSDNARHIVGGYSITRDGLIRFGHKLLLVDLRSQHLDDAIAAIGDAVA